MKEARLADALCQPDLYLNPMAAYSTWWNCDS